MTKNEAKNIIIGMINEKQGCKATELAADLVLMNFENHKPLSLLNELVQEKRIIEIEYILPQMDYRVKSFYLPIGAKVRVLGE